MKFIISTQDLNNLINKCLNVISPKATVPVLSNILIEAVNDELVLTATDLMVGVRCFREAKILEEGATTLPAKRFAQLIRELTAKNIEVTSDANEITEVIANSSRFKLHGMTRNEFPELPNVTGAVNFPIKQKDLKELLFRTAFAVSREDNRYVLTGIFMQIANGIITFGGTDGKRLAKTYAPINIDPSFSGTYILPLKAVEEILKNLTGNNDSEATLFIMNDKIAVEAENCMVVTKLLSGDYPDLSRIIPTNSGTTIILHREELMTLLRQISLFIADTTHSVRFTFTNGELKLSANTMEIGEGKVSMPVNYQGQKLEIAFNPGFFLDILRHSKEETVTITLTDSYNPGLITDNRPQPQDSNEILTHALFVLMPMRLNEE